MGKAPKCTVLRSKYQNFLRVAPRPYFPLLKIPPSVLCTSHTAQFQNFPWVVPQTPPPTYPLKLVWNSPQNALYLRLKFKNFLGWPTWETGRGTPPSEPCPLCTSRLAHGTTHHENIVPLGKAEPLISTAACQNFDLDPWPLTLTLGQCNSDVKTRILAFDFDLRPWPSIPT